MKKLKGKSAEVAIVSELDRCLETCVKIGSMSSDERRPVSFVSVKVSINIFFLYRPTFYITNFVVDFIFLDNNYIIFRKFNFIYLKF